MGVISVPNLVLDDALRFCYEFDNYEWEAENTFDFSAIKKCDPFPMLLTAHKIKEARALHKEDKCCGRNINHSYAKNMRYFRFIGMDEGKPMNEDYGNQNYLPISELNLLDLMKKSRLDGIPLGEIITNKSRTLATVLSRGNEKMKETMTFCLREIIRNIPEHSNSNQGWYCAQYWPSYDLVELAILDNGIGILQSINSNYLYACERLSNENAIIKALQAGISRTFDDNGNEEIFLNTGNVWKNSGYGLFVVSRICAKTGGSFILASGDTAIKVEDNEGDIHYKSYKTNINGTAIRIRIKVNAIHRINEIMKEIKEEGEYTSGNRFKNASKASMFFFKE